MKTPLAAAFALLAFVANAQAANVQAVPDSACLIRNGSISRVAETHGADAPAGQLACKQFLSTTAVVRPSRPVHA